MGRPIISIEGLGKCYRLGHKAEVYPTFRAALVDALKTPLRRLKRLSEAVEGGSEVFWALKDVNFEVNRGDVVGVIGRNGAGKSTLLKLLSRITEPTEGIARMRGRVASLLEVGTGFHPELTGRENIYLNGSILGMKKVEIKRKFDQIVEFAEVEKFLDTQVKRYSSGMYVRLAFAVAAHLEPEILVVDEVLAVGDAAFQKKCLGKMREVAKGEGRTVLFVSHNMPAVRSLCSRCVMLQKGKLLMDSDPDTTTARYMEQVTESEIIPTNTFRRPAGSHLWMTSATVLANGKPSTAMRMGGELSIEVKFESEVPVRRPMIGFIMWTAQGDRLINVNNKYLPGGALDQPATKGTIRCDLGKLPLVGGRYFIWLYLGDHNRDSHVVENALSFDVVEYDAWGQGTIPSAVVAPMWWPTKIEMARE